LANSTHVTIEGYYKSFKSLQGLLAAAFCFLPSASNLVRPGSVFPPLGKETLLAQFFLVVCGVAITYLMFLMKDVATIRVKRTINVFFASAFIIFGVYFWLHFRFVRTIEIPSVGTEEIVSVGYERSQSAKAIFDDESDFEMLHSRGFTEDEIRELWTPRSLCIARLLLFGCFAGFILPMVALASLGVLLRVRGA
jgi:hypothetical protein